MISIYYICTYIWSNLSLWISMAVKTSKELYLIIHQWLLLKVLTDGPVDCSYNDNSCFVIQFNSVPDTHCRFLTSEERLWWWIKGKCYDITIILLPSHVWYTETVGLDLEMNSVESSLFVRNQCFIIAKFSCVTKQTSYPWNYVLTKQYNFEHPSVYNTTNSLLCVGWGMCEFCLFYA